MVTVIYDPDSGNSKENAVDPALSQTLTSAGPLRGPSPLCTAIGGSNDLHVAYDASHDVLGEDNDHQAESAASMRGAGTHAVRQSRTVTLSRLLTRTTATLLMPYPYKEHNAP